MCVLVIRGIYLILHGIHFDFINRSWSSIWLIIVYCYKIPKILKTASTVDSTAVYVRVGVG